MVMVASAILPSQDGAINIEAWLQTVAVTFSENETALIRQACVFVQSNCPDNNTPLKKSCFNLGLQIANLLLSLHLDAESITASILYPMLQYSELNLDDVHDQFPNTICKILKGTLQMDGIGALQRKINAHAQVDNFRRMLLSMVDDVRVVVIKLAERTVYMRHINQLNINEQHTMAQQAMDIYATLANRLGILEIKWEMEDLAFHILQPIKYKMVAKHVNERRLDREQFVQDFKTELTSLLSNAGIKFELYGRAKHIYSIYSKMQRKDVGFKEIYDATAFRILVDDVTDCYTALSVVHSTWPHVDVEFDDYIATPKANGYQSIHTVAIVGAKKRNVEIQIRTEQMHEDNELGVAAHWLYKEGGGNDGSYQRKISWLRQLLDWQREVADHHDVPDDIAQGIAEDRVYVFTPNDEVISLPQDSTPLDFAYYIHSEIGHKCRGAKVNGRMVPLTYKLTLGDKIDILTSKEPSPSRDWLNPQQGYLNTARARSKVHSWFKKRDYDQNLADGHTIFHRELKRLNLSSVEPGILCKRFHLQNGHDVLAAIGCGDIRIPQIVGALQEQLQQKPAPEPEDIKNLINKSKRYSKAPKGILVDGVNDLLSQVANCCKPLPGENIVGYITMGRGVTIHRDDCKNIAKAKQNHPERLVDASWGDVQKQSYAVDLVLEAHNRKDLLRDITRVLSDDNINIYGLNSYADKHNNITVINLSLEINDMPQLGQIQNRLLGTKDVIAIRRQ